MAGALTIRSFQIARSFTSGYRPPTDPGNPDSLLEGQEFINYPDHVRCVGLGGGGYVESSFLTDAQRVAFGPIADALAALAASANGKQPLDVDLTAIAALATTGYGRALLTLVDAAAARGAVGLGNVANLAPADLPVSTAQATINAALQPLDSDLTAISALATTAYGRALLTLSDAAAGRSALGVVNLDIARADIAGRVIPLQAFTVQGFSSVGDGGQGATYVRGTSGGLMAVQDAAGTWWNLAVAGGLINVCWFGASPSSSDSAPAINAAILAAKARAVSNYWSASGVSGVYVPAGMYVVSGINLFPGIAFVSDNPGATKFVLKAGSNRSVISVAPAPVGDPAPWSSFGQVLLRGFSIDGNASNQTGTSHGIEFTDAPYPIGTRYGTSGRIENVDINATLNAGIYAGKNRNFGFVSKVIIQYANRYGIDFNTAYDWSVADSSIGVCGLGGANVYYSGALTITNTAIYGNIGPGIQVQEGFGSYLWMTGGCLEGNTTHGLAVIPPAGSTNGVIGLANVHLINNSAGADNTSSHVHVRNFAKLSLSNVTARVHPSTNPGAKYIIDNDTTAPVAVSNLMYDTSGSEVPYKTAPFANPSLIVGAANPLSGSFGLYSPLMVRAANGIDLCADFDGGTARAQFQVYSGGTPAGHGAGFYDMLLQPKGGNLGIGTVAPGAKLDVAGTMRAQPLSLGAAPTASNIPAGLWTVVKNTADGSVRLYVNDGGTLKSVVLT